MVKALFSLAKYLTWWFIKPLVSRCYVANLSHMLRTSSSNKTHVLVASNNISLSRLEGRIYIITSLNPLPVLIILLNPLPVLVALKIFRGILIYTLVHMLVHDKYSPACLENSDRKVKQFRTIPRLASSRLLYSSSMQCPKWMCLVLQRDSRFVSRKLSRNRHCTDWTAWLVWLLYHLQW